MCLAVPYAGSASPCVAPAAAGYFATLIGDRWGTTRGVAAGPMLASYVAALGWGCIGVFGVAWIATAGQTDVANDPAAWLFLGGGAVAAVVGTAGVPALYALSAEPKQPHDDGSLAPGFFSHAHPPVPTSRAPLGNARPMRY